MSQVVNSVTISSLLYALLCKSSRLYPFLWKYFFFSVSHYVSESLSISYKHSFNNVFLSLFLVCLALSLLTLCSFTIYVLNSSYSVHCLISYYSSTLLSSATNRYFFPLKLFLNSLCPLLQSLISLSITFLSLRPQLCDILI